MTREMEESLLNNEFKELTTQLNKTRDELNNFMGSEDFLNKVLLSIQLLGQIKEKLNNILDDRLFNDLSKHNPYWNSEHEVEYEKLYDTRCALSTFENQLWGIIGLINGDY